MTDGGDPRGEYAHACARPDAGCGKTATDARAAAARTHGASGSPSSIVAIVSGAIVLAAVVALVGRWISRRRP